MKFKVTLKDPDALDDPIAEAVAASLVSESRLSVRELEVLGDERIRECIKVAGKWFEYGEYLTVEIDTAAGTCVVVPR